MGHYPKLSLQEFFYPTPTPGVHIQWNRRINPFFARKHLEKDLPHFQVLKPLLRKLRKHMSGEGGIHAMIGLAQSLIYQNDLEEATAQQLKEYPRKRRAIGKACIRALLAFPAKNAMYHIRDLRLHFWRSLQGLQEAERFCREIPERKAYVLAVRHLLTAEAGNYPKAREAVAQIIAEIFFDPFLPIWGVKNWVRNHFRSGKCRDFTPASWSGDRDADQALWEQIHNHWVQADKVSYQAFYNRLHPPLPRKRRHRYITTVSIRRKYS